MVTRASFWGRVAALMLLYGSLSLYLFTLHFSLFGLPVRGSVGAVVAILVPYLLAVILLGELLRRLFRAREEPLPALLWASIPLLMLSGISLPQEAMPAWLGDVAGFVPSTPAIRAFVRAHTMGASLAEIAPEVVRLWLLVGLYGLLLLVVDTPFSLRKR